MPGPKPGALPLGDAPILGTFFILSAKNSLSRDFFFSPYFIEANLADIFSAFVAALSIIFAVSPAS